jgi:ascorbate-specific PTS system EIIC-type component UlaA
MKKWWKNFINSDASTTVFIILVFVVTFVFLYFGMSYEKGKQTANGEKVHYSSPIKDRAHGGVGYGFGYSPRTHRFGYGFGTGSINFH